MNQIEIIARAIVIKDGKILLCRGRGRKNWFFPGGHVEMGETVLDALKREFQEEIGVEIVEADFIGVVEKSFIDEEGENHQEINLVFKVKVRDGDVRSLEAHLDFCWMKLSDMAGELVLPEALKNSISKWLEDEKVFYVN